MDELLDHNSTRSNVGQDELADSFSMRVFQTALIVDKYYTPLLFIFGTLGNSLSLLVFCMNAKYRSQSASYYLSALAISDTGFLVNLLAVWLEGVHGGIITSGLMCPLVMYLGQVTCFMSVYLTVAFSIERYVAVHYPLSRPRICTRSKARRIIAALTVVALVAFSYAWVIAQVIEMPSGEDPEYMYQDLSPTNRTSVGAHLRKSFGDGKHVTRASFPSSLEMLSESNAGQNSARITSNCVNGNYTVSSNDSRHINSHSQQPNCSHSFQDEMILKGFQLSSGESNEESVLNGEDVWEEKGTSGEDRNFLSGYMCSVPEDYYRISEIANYLDSVVTLIIPIFLITFFNVRIAICVWKLKDQRQGIVALSTTDINHHHGLRCSNKSSMHHKKGSSKQSSSNNTRKHLAFPQHRFTTPFEENPIGDNRTAKLESGDIFSNTPKQSSQVRFEDADRLSQQNNGSTSSGSEGNSHADHFDGEHAAAGTSIQYHAKRNAAAFGGFPGKSHIMRWKTKHQTTSTRMGKKEFSVVGARRSSGHAPSNAAEVRVTKTLLLVSTVFLVLNLPSHAIRCAQFIQSLRGTSEGQELIKAMQPWANILFNTNFAVNFLLYCLSGRNFRKSLKNIFRKLGRRSSIIKKKGKKLEQSRLPFSTNFTGIKRNCNNEFHVTEIVELEDRVGDSTYPNNNSNMVNHIDDDEEEEISMSV